MFFTYNSSIPYNILYGDSAKKKKKKRQSLIANKDREGHTVGSNGS